MTAPANIVQEIASLQLPTRVIPTQNEVREFVKKFTELDSHVSQYKNFANTYKSSSSLKKWWDSDSARDQMLLALSTVGELSVLANKLLALNVVFAQHINHQTVDISAQSVLIEKSQAAILELSAELKEAFFVRYNIINQTIEAQSSEINELRTAQENCEAAATSFSSALSELLTRTEALQAQNVQLKEALEEQNNELNVLRSMDAHHQKVVTDTQLANKKAIRFCIALTSIAAASAIYSFIVTYAS